jgi:hypothetical protein
VRSKLYPCYLYRFFGPPTIYLKKSMSSRQYQCYLLNVIVIKFKPFADYPQKTKIFKY